LPRPRGGRSVQEAEGKKRLPAPRRNAHLRQLTRKGTHDARASCIPCSFLKKVVLMASRFCVSCVVFLGVSQQADNNSWTTKEVQKRHKNIGGSPKSFSRVPASSSSRGLRGSCSRKWCSLRCQWPMGQWGRLSHYSHEARGRQGAFERSFGEVRPSAYNKAPPSRQKGTHVRFFVLFFFPLRPLTIMRIYIDIGFCAQDPDPDERREARAGDRSSRVGSIARGKSREATCDMHHQARCP
jgi:hypothetical protein